MLEFCQSISNYFSDILRLAKPESFSSRRHFNGILIHMIAIHLYLNDYISKKCSYSLKTLDYFNYLFFFVKIRKLCYTLCTISKKGFI